MGMIIKKGFFRTIFAKKYSYIGAAFLLSLGVMLYITLTATMDTLKTSSQMFSDQYEQEDFHFFSSSDLTPQQESAIEKKYNLELEKRYFLDVPLKGKKEIRLFSLTSKINQPYVQKGTIPSKRNEIALAVNFAKNNDLALNDKLQLNGKALEVTGFIHIPDYIYSLKNETDFIMDADVFGIAVTDSKTLHSLTQQPNFYYIGKYNRPLSSRQADSLKQNIAHLTPILKWMDAKENPRISTVKTEIKSTSAFSTTIPLFVVVLVMLMVIMMVKRQLESQRKEIGTMAAFGYYRRELFGHYLMYPLFISIAGTIIGLILGVAASIPLTNYYTTFFNMPILSMVSMKWSRFIFALLIPIAVLLVSGMAVIYRVIRLKPLQLLKQAPSAQTTQSRLEKLRLFQFKRFSSRFRFRMLIRHKIRIVYLCVGIIFSTILITLGLMWINITNTLVHSTYDEVMRYNYSTLYQLIQTKAVQPKESPFTVGKMKVERVSHDSDSPRKVNQKVQVYGIDWRTEMIFLKNKQGKKINSLVKDGAVISKNLANSLDVQKNDSLLITNEWNGKKKKIRIKDVAELYMGQSLYLDLNTVNEWMGFPQDSYIGKWSMDKPPKTEAGVLTMEDKASLVHSLNQLISPLRYSVYLMDLLSVLIGVVIISIITNLMIEENSASISLMKVMGYHEKKISSYMINIYTPVVVFGYVLGVPIAIKSLEAVVKSIASETNYTLPVNMTVQMFLVGFFVTLFTYWLALLVSKHQLKKVPLQEVLKKQEL